LRFELGAVVLALVACSSADTAPPSVTSQARPSVPPSTGGPTSQECPDAAAVHPPDSTCVKVVRGQLVDSTTQGVSAPIAVCGGGVICAGSVAAEGLFDVPLNRFVDLSTFVLHVYGHPVHGDLIVRLPRATTTDVTIAPLPLVPIFETKGGILPPSVASSTVVRSGPVELTLAAGTTTTVAPAHENTRELLAGVVSDAATWDPNVLTLYAVGPFSALFTPRVAVAITLPAAKVVADGTTLDLVVLDDDIVGGHAGTLLKVGSAIVTGGVARSVAGVGIDHLTWVGVRTPTGG
jgi:hypothetical protein